MAVTPCLARRTALASLASRPTPPLPLPQASLQAPSIYELLPPLDFPWARPPPQLTLWLKTPIPPPTGQHGQGAAAGPGLPCASHQQFAVNPAATAVAPPQGSVAGDASSLGLGDGGGLGLCGGGGLQQAHQYIFSHEHLPGLLTRLLRHNAGELRAAGGGSCGGDGGAPMTQVARVDC